MKSKFLLVGLCVLLCAGVAQAGDSDWFDMENCAMCKNLMTDPELLNHTVWEIHVIGSGMMTFTVVEPEYQEAMDTAAQNMELAGAAMMAGKEMEVCNFCQSMGGLMMGGAQVEEVTTAGGKIMLITSGDPAMVKKIQAHAEKTNEEFAKMTAHDHGGE